MPTTYPDFGAATTATEVAAAFATEIVGKTVLITGISPASLGAALATSLAAHSPGLLILASRTPSNLHAVAQSITSSFPSVQIKELSLDLASLASIRRAAVEITDFLSREGRGIDVLFNNAGINISERLVSPDGLELQFATNHIGPFLFTNLLLPLMVHSPASSTRLKQQQKWKRRRIINTSSEAHVISPIRFHDYNLEIGKQVPGDEEPRRSMRGVLRGDGGYEPSVAYGQSKTANVLFAVGLRGRVGGQVGSWAVNPGNIMTDLVRGMDEKGLKGLEAIDKWKTQDGGAATMVVAGFDPSLKDDDGVYLDDCQMKRAARWATDPEKAERLWKLSEEIIRGSGRGSRL